MLAHLRAAVLLLVLTLGLCAVAYPLLLLGIGKAVFPAQAEGSLIRDGDKVIGSRLLAQGFKGAKWFHPRPSAAGDDGYDASSSGGSNLAPTNSKLRERAAGILGDRKEPLPVDAVTASGSGLDPHITKRNAHIQLDRVAAAWTDTGLSSERIRERLLKLIERHAGAPLLGFAGEPLVNVLELNLAVREAFAAPR